MLDISYSINPIARLPDEDRLVRQAQSGSEYAFAQLYDECVELVYRYITFRVEHDRIAEDITKRVFFKAWENLDQYRASGISIVEWLFKFAQSEISVYYATHERTTVQVSSSISLAGGQLSLNEDIRDIIEFQELREGLRFLTEKEQQALILKFIVGLPNKNIAHIMSNREKYIRALYFRALQKLTRYLQEREIIMINLQRILEDCLMRLSRGTATVDECLALYSGHAKQLELLLSTVFLLNRWHVLKPSPTFTAYTRFSVIQFAQSHLRQSRRFLLSRRTAITMTVLVITLLVTGTAHAQSAMPGDVYYDWKRNSELAWRVIAPDPIAVDIVLSKRRLNEWIAVANDPILNISAQISYQEALSRLEHEDNGKSRALIVSELQSQQRILKNAGLTTSEIDNYLAEINTPVLIPVTGVEPGEKDDSLIETDGSSTDVQTEIINECPPDCGEKKGNVSKDGEKNAGSNSQQGKKKGQQGNDHGNEGKDDDHENNGKDPK